MNPHDIRTWRFINQSVKLCESLNRAFDSWFNTSVCSGRLRQAQTSSDRLQCQEVIQPWNHRITESDCMQSQWKDSSSWEQTQVCCRQHGLRQRLSYFVNESQEEKFWTRHLLLVANKHRQQTHSITFKQMWVMWGVNVPRLSHWQHCCVKRNPLFDRSPYQSDHCH